MTKSDQLKQIIREIVHEEIQKELPSLIPSVLSEILTGKKQSSEKHESEDFFSSLKKEDNSSKQVKTPKKYSTNPLINQILNETEGGVPQEASYGQQMLPPVQKMPSQKLNIKEQPVSSASPVLNEETKAQAEIGIFKDYRKLMKAVDTKKKAGGFLGGSVGGLSIDGGVPTDFSTID